MNGVDRRRIDFRGDDYRRFGGIRLPLCHHRLGRRTEDKRSFVITSETQQAATGRIFKQVPESPEAVVVLVEAGIAALDDLLEDGCPDPVAVAPIGHEIDESGMDNLDGLGFALFLFFATLGLFFRRTLFALFALRTPCLAVTHQVVVINELIAIGDEQIGTGLLDAHADDFFGVFTQFRHQRRKIGIAGDDHEGVDMGFGVAQVQRIDDHADVGRILAGLAHMRDFDQFEIGLVHGGLKAFVAIPVAIRLLDHDTAFGEQALEHRANIEFFVLGIAHAEGDVLEIAKERHAGGIVG